MNVSRHAQINSEILKDNDSMIQCPEPVVKSDVVTMVRGKVT